MSDVITRPSGPARQELECGHRQPVKPESFSAWCPICGELVPVRGH